MLKKRDKQRVEVTQMKFLGHLLGITKLDWEKNQSVREKLGVQNLFLGNTTVSAKVATTLTGNGQKQGTKAGPALSHKRRRN